MFYKQIIPLLFLCLSSIFFMVACNPPSSSQSSSDSSQSPPITPPDPLAPNTNNTEASPSDEKNTVKATTDDKSFATEDQTSTEKILKDSDTTKQFCPDTLQPLTPSSESSLLFNTSCCKKPITKVHSLIISGRGNTVIDSAREVIKADLLTGASTADDLISPLVRQSGNKPHLISLPGVTEKGEGFKKMFDQNAAVLESTIQMIGKEIDPNNPSLLIIIINDHGSTNGTTSFTYSDLLSFLVKYIPPCTYVQISNGACESSAIVAKETVSDAINKVGGEILQPLKDQWRKEHPDHEGLLPDEVSKEMMELTYQKMPKFCNISVHYAARVREGLLPKEENINYCDGGFIVAWAKGFVDSVKKGGGLPIQQNSLSDAMNAADAHNTNKDQHPGATVIPWNEMVNQEFGK